MLSGETSLQELEAFLFSNILTPTSYPQHALVHAESTRHSPSATSNSRLVTKHRQHALHSALRNRPPHRIGNREYNLPPSGDEHANENSLRVQYNRINSSHLQAENQNQNGQAHAVTDMEHGPVQAKFVACIANQCLPFDKEGGGGGVTCRTYGTR